MGDHDGGLDAVDEGDDVERVAADLGAFGLDELDVDGGLGALGRFALQALAQAGVADGAEERAQVVQGGGVVQHVPGRVRPGPVTALGCRRPVQPSM